MATPNAVRSTSTDCWILPGEAMSDTWQLVEVARRLGYGDLFPWDEGGHIEGNLERVHPVP